MEMPEKGRFDDIEQVMDQCTKLSRPELLEIKEWLEREILRALEKEKVA